MQNDGWVKPFLTLDLCGGTLVSILNDDEDMLEIRWPGGMWIDVGFIEEENISANISIECKHLRSLIKRRPSHDEEIPELYPVH